LKTQIKSADTKIFLFLYYWNKYAKQNLQPSNFNTN